MHLSRLLVTAVLATSLGACASNTSKRTAPILDPAATQSAQRSSNASSNQASRKTTTDTPARAATLQAGTAKNSAEITYSKLKEISGITSATAPTIRFWAVNDSGNGKYLYAVNNDGSLHKRYALNVRNRDWESLSRTSIGLQTYLIIGDTGDNLRLHKNLKLHFITEPLPEADSSKPLNIAHTLSFTFPDGKHNVEAMAVTDNAIYLISKEPLDKGDAVAAKLYRLALNPELLNQPQSNSTQQAQYVGQMQLRPTSLSTRLAASFAGVDLNQATALSFSKDGLAAYVLTYRQVIRFDRLKNESWEQALSKPGRVIHNHGLRQAEAITIDNSGVLWITSEKLPAPILSLPTTVLYE